jgi:hypothetical protein
MKKGELIDPSVTISVPNELQKLYPAQDEIRNHLAIPEHFQYTPLVLKRGITHN